MPARQSVLLVAFALLVLPALARRFDRCQLATELYYHHGLPWHQLASWVCVAYYESHLDTAAVGYGNHGLFQISDQYWCSPPGRGTACGVSCDRLRDDDISDDVVCARRIFHEHQRLSGDGFTAWSVYRQHCSGGRAYNFLYGCF